MIKDIFEAYIKMRNELNPYKEPTSPKWDEAYRLSMQEFSTLLKTIPYKSDA